MASEGKEITLGKAKLYRFICRLTFILLAFVTPLLITGFKFQLFTQATTAKWSITGLIIVLIIVWRFKKRLGDWINSWENSNIFKHVLIGFSKVWPFVLIVAILALIKFNAEKTNSILNNALFCLEWTAACEIVSYLVIYPFEMRFDYLVQRMIRKNERKADYKEAIKEMREEEEGNK